MSRVQMRPVRRRVVVGMRPAMAVSGMCVRVRVRPCMRVRAVDDVAGRGGMHRQKLALRAAHAPPAGLLDSDGLVVWRHIALS